MSGSRKIQIDMPCGVFYNLFNIILDLNGTITVDGGFVDGVVERLKEISEIMDAYVVTADTVQTLDHLTDQLVEECGIKIHQLESGRGDLQKLAFLEELGRDKTVAIGNGCNDALMLKEAKLGLCVIGKEGASSDALIASDAIFFNICDALDILLKPKRMIATLRK
ncbi:MAG: ATPase P [Thermodesulfobacteriota bacterium]|nr:ATPase P [Thermodesulfobacteriota bacterium]